MRVSKTFEIQGHYTGKVILRCKAAGLFDAMRKFQNSEEEQVEIINLSAIEIDEKTLREK